MVKKLTVKELKGELKKLDHDWSVNDTRTEITREFSFRSFMESFMFVTKLAIYCEVAKHYPKIELQGPLVTITILATTTNNFHKKDFELLKKIDQVFSLSTKKKVR